MAKPEDNNRELFQQETFRQNKRKFDIFEEEIELSLGLSLNGRFGFDPNRTENAPLVRSSSVSNFVFSGGGAAESSPEPAEAGLGRTWSMPSGTAEEWRRRKEAQSARRMEAKRKRVERMMSGRMGERHVAARAEGGPMEERHVAVGLEGGPMGERHVAVGLGGETEGRPSAKVPNIPVETRSPSSVQSQQNEQKQTVSIEATQNSKQSSTRPTNIEPKEMMKNMMADMPCVSTRGVGPNGKRIEGFLYRYRKGEEVRIVCVCHGSFLSPAEFVKHAGGGDVSQPLKHIVVNPSPLM